MFPPKHPENTEEHRRTFPDWQPMTDGSQDVRQMASCHKAVLQLQRRHSFASSPDVRAPFGQICGNGAAQGTK